MEAEAEGEAAHADQFQYSAPEPSPHSCGSRGSTFQRILRAVDCAALNSQEDAAGPQPRQQQQQEQEEKEEDEEGGEGGAAAPTQLDHEPLEELPSATQLDSEKMGRESGSQLAQQTQEAGSAGAWDVPDSFVKPHSQAESAFESPHAQHLSMHLSLRLGASPAKHSQSPQSAKQTQSDDVTQLPPTTQGEAAAQIERESNTVVQTQFDLHLTLEEQAQEGAEPTQFSLHVEEDVRGPLSHRAEQFSDDGRGESSGRGSDDDEDDDDGVVQTQFDLHLDESEPGAASQHAASQHDTPSSVHAAEVGSSGVRLQFSADTEPATPTPADPADHEAPSSGWKPRRSLDPPPAESPVESQHAQPREGPSLWASLVRRPEAPAPANACDEEGPRQPNFTSKRRKKSATTQSKAARDKKANPQLYMPSDGPPDDDEYGKHEDDTEGENEAEDRGKLATSEQEEREWVEEDVKGVTEQLDEHDIPLSLTAADVASMTPVQLWRVLKKHGWQYKRGRHLVDWYYIRPGRDTTAEYTEGVDYFQADQLLEYAQIHVLSRESAMQQQEEEEERRDGEQDSAAEEEENGGEEGGGHELEYDENGGDSDDDDGEDTTHGAGRSRTAMSASAATSTLSKKRSRPAAARPEEFAGANTMRFAELWDKLKRLGWTSVYGSGLVERYYLCPGVDKHSGVVGVNMFESEDQVREFVCREFLGEDVGRKDETGESKRRRRPSRGSASVSLHEELSSDDDAAIEQYSAPSQPPVVRAERHKGPSSKGDSRRRSQGARATSTSPGKRPKARQSRPVARTHHERYSDDDGGEAEHDGDYQPEDSLDSATPSFHDYTPNTKRQKFADGQLDVVLRLTDDLPPWATRMSRASSDVTPAPASRATGSKAIERTSSRPSRPERPRGAVTPSKRTPPSLQKLLSSRTSDDGVRLARGGKSKMFEGLRFLLTGLSASEDRALGSSSISELIKQHSGTVIALSDVKHPADNVIVVAHPAAYRKLSFLWALACGCAAVHPLWVRDSVHHGMLQELDRYQLPYGIARDSDVFLFRERYDRSQRRPFKGLRIAHTIEPQDTWNKILEAAGAVVVPVPRDDRMPRATVDLLLRPDVVIVDPLRSTPSQMPEYLRKRLRSEVLGARTTPPLLLSVDWLAACLGSSVFLEPDSGNNFWAQLEPHDEDLPAVKDESGERFVPGDFVTYVRSSGGGATCTGRIVQLMQRGDLKLGKLKQYRRTGTDTLVATNIVDVVPVQSFQRKLVVIAAEAFEQVAYAGREPALCRLAVVRTVEREHDEPVASQVDEEDY